MNSLYPLQTLAGMILVVMSPTLREILSFFGVEERGGGLLYFSYFAGGTLSTLSISWLARLFTSSMILRVAACICALGLLAFSVSTSLVAAVVAIFFVGAMNGIFVGFPGALIADQYREHSSGPMNFLYSFVALGVTLCPLLAGYCLSIGIAWQIIFQVLAVLSLAWAIASAFVSLPDIREAEGLSWSTLNEVRRAEPVLLIGAILLNILYVGAETSIVGWVIYYLQEIFSADSSVFRASRVLTYFWAGMIIGRIITGIFIKRLGSLRALVLLLSGAFLLWAGALLTSRLIMAEVLFSGIGLFFSGIYPLIASYAGRFPLRYTGLVLSVILAGGGVGGALFPLLVGFLAQWKGIHTGMASVLPIPLLMLMLLVWLRSKRAAV